MDYKGYTEYTFANDVEMANFYGNMAENSLSLMVNEYCLLYSHDGVLVDKIKWDGIKNIAVTYKAINNDWFSKIKPINIEQELAFDMLQDKNTTIKLVTGRMGSGKTYLTVCHALQALKQNKFDKIIYLRNNVSVKDVPEIGYLPGTELEKICNFALPVADALGGKDGLNILMMQGKLEIVPLGFIRGRDFKNSAIIVSEAENLTAQHVQLIIGRVGEGSTLYFDGDIKQVDKKIFETNNGITKAIDVLKGNKLFGYVQLQKTERSETAALADLFD